jgi:hypothetical protein
MSLARFADPSRFFQLGSVLLSCCMNALLLEGFSQQYARIAWIISHTRSSIPKSADTRVGILADAGNCRIPSGRKSMSFQGSFLHQIATAFDTIA